MQLKIIARWGVITLVGVNAIAATVAYALTHYRSRGQISLGAPKPVNSKTPADIGLKYTTQRIPLSSKAWLETWRIPAPHSNSDGTVLLFPGSGSSKGPQLLPPAQAFNALSYDALLVDFQGVGGSSGNSKTLGMREAQDVTAAFGFAKRSKAKQPIVLYGVSMGSAAILRAIAQDQIKPDAIILELPFAYLLDAVKSRFQVFKVPASGLAELLVFWGGLQHGLNGFAHNPATFAKQVNCPALVLQGEQDRWTSITEVKHLVKNLGGSKELVVFPKAGHQLLVTVNKAQWTQSVETFLRQIKDRSH